MRMALNPMADVLVRDKRGQTQRRSRVKGEAETGGTRPRAQGRLELQKLEEAGRTVPWSLLDLSSPARAWISTFGSPERKNDKFLSEATMVLAICLASY